MSWTEEKVNKLKDLWGKGNTASQIAEILGGVSRNAVIGKAHRLNLSAKIIKRSTTHSTNNLKFKEMLEKLLNLIGKKRLLIPMPLAVAQLSARFFEIMPKPILTRDQLKILKYDNVLSGQYKSNIDIGIIPKLKFDQEILKYSYMWKEGGQYSK